MKCRLLQNTIIGGKFIERGTIVDDTELTERLKIDTVVAYDLEDCGGKVLVLRDLSFQSIAKPGSDGVRVSYPTLVASGELLDLSKVPPSHRRSLTEGSDYKTKWTLEEQKQLQNAEQAAYLKQFETETVIPR